MSTVADILEDASLQWTGVVPWGCPVPSQSPGVYIVSLSSDYDRNSALPRCDPPIDLTAVQRWLENVPTMKLDDRVVPSPEAVADRLREFWLFDENILYIGQTSKPLRKRVHQYYRTPLGARSPHRGGHWVKVLSTLRESYVHYAETENPERSEYQLLRAFVSRVSPDAKTRLRDCGRPFPFANLEFPKGNRRRHGLTCQAR